MKNKNILQIILTIAALAVLVFCIAMKFYCIYEFSDVPISETPTWAWFWLK